jgi:hypothetical protein
MSEARLNWTLGASRIDLHLDGDEDIGILWDAIVTTGTKKCDRHWKISTTQWIVAWN